VQDIKDAALGGSSSSFDLSEEPKDELDADYDPTGDH